MEFLALNGDGVDGKFHTLVGDFTNVGRQSIELITVGADCVPVDEVLGAFVIVFDSTTQASIQDLKVDT